MCGIVGYIGKKQAIPFLIKGLEKLEYRGYDSSGIAISHNNEIKCLKKSGKLECLKNILRNKNNLNGNIGIGHTRWATHGNPTDINAHPHISKSKRIAVVHNGIIENYVNIKKFLMDKGIKFISETDTEVIAELIDYHFNGDILEAVKKCISQIEGSFALGIINNQTNQLIAVRKDSPLIIGFGDKENYIASDIPAVLPYTKKIYRMGNKTIAILTDDSVTIQDFNNNILKFTPTTINWNIESSEKGGYKHFMLKEIMEQPDVLSKTITPRIKNNDIYFENITFSEQYLRNINKIYIVACGSAYHVGCVGKYILEKFTRKSVEIDIASEFRYRNPILNTKTLVIVISQSGETADTLAALREAKKYGAKVLSIVNVVGSSIATESDNVIYTWAGPEIAVATTKAYSTQLSIIYLLGIYFAKILNTISRFDYINYIKNVTELPKLVEKTLDEKNINMIKSISRQYHNINNAFFIGRTLDYAVCMEGSLKLKEISYIHSEAYAAGELKHGTISLIEKGTFVIVIATQDELLEKTISNMLEVKSRGARILTIIFDDKKDMVTNISNYVISIPRTNCLFSPSLSIIPLQLLSYYMALFRNCNIDKPRNLAKSVTVE